MTFEHGPLYLDRLGVLLGYSDFAPEGDANGHRKPKTPNDNPGPTGGGKRSATTWSAKHSPLVEEMALVLDDLRWKSCDGSPWSPDIVRRSPNSKGVVLIEVKPDISTHNMITAIGQIACYRTSFETDVIGIVAAPGTSRVNKATKKALDRYEIKTLDLNHNIKAQLANLAV